MAKLSVRLWMVVVAGLVLIIGCGGGGSEGSTSGSSPNDQTRSRLMKTLGFSQIAMLQGGFQTLGQAGAINDPNSVGTSGTTGTTGLGMPMIGAFIRNMGSGPAPLFASRLRGRGTTGGTDGGGGTTGDGSTGDGTTGDGSSGTTSSGGGNDGPYLYFDEWLGLWVETSWTENSWTTLLFIDAEKTQPAGSFQSTYSGWDTYPITGTSTYEISAGPFAGAHGRYETVYNSDYSGRMDYDNFWPTYGSDEGTSTWNQDGWTWSSSQSLEDGTWSKSSGSYGNDGVGRFVWENSDGYKWTYTYNADGSGSGLIQGPDFGLPAKVTWTPEGHYRIEYADGTVEEWDMWTGDGGVGFGTTGGGGVVGGGSTTTTGSTGP
jgi:hypothetical protein